MSATSGQDADFERLVLRILEDLTESPRSVQSMAAGGDYEDTRLWSVEHDLKLLTALIDGPEVVLAACHPGCGWNGEVAVADGQWTCPQCGKRQPWADHSDGADDAST